MTIVYFSTIAYPVIINSELPNPQETNARYYKLTLGIVSLPSLFVERLWRRFDGAHAGKWRICRGGKCGP